MDFTTDLKNITDLNIRKKMTEITKEINNWTKRDLSPLGKIVVLKTLILSKIVHLLIALPSPSEKNYERFKRPILQISLEWWS